MLKPIEWGSDHVKIIDQRRLPSCVVWLNCFTSDDIAEAILTMKIRGAPAIGVAAAFGLALAALRYNGENTNELLLIIKNAALSLKKTRPTAYNLFWAVDRMIKSAENNSRTVEQCRKALEEEALLIMAEDQNMCKAIGEAGAELLKERDYTRLLTHCNAGALATAGWGTALGVIRSAHFNGMKIHVFVDETRPALQGARLTSWELSQEGIPYTLITDNMAGFLMQKGKVDAVIVGADRITSNGDFANKIGTYSLAILAKAHGIPFYAAAPYSTVDLSLSKGEQIPVEERSPDEVTHIKDVMIAPHGISVWNPAFDITPHQYVTAFITERGVILPPFQENFSSVYQEKVG